MRKSFSISVIALFLAFVLSGCALALPLLSSTAFIGGMAILSDQNAERCFKVETKILTYTAKDTPRYRRDMTKEDCNI